jgi:hypothetical protein
VRRLLLLLLLVLATAFVTRGGGAAAVAAARVGCCWCRCFSHSLTLCPHQGAISKAEFYRILQVLGIPATEDELTIMWPIMYNEEHVSRVHYLE